MAGEIGPPINATVSGTASNSYATEAEADALMAAEFGSSPAAWRAEASADRKRAALVAATRMIDRVIRWAGAKWSDRYRPTVEQALEFPRDRHTDDFNPTTPELPTQVRDACILQAAYLIGLDAAGSGSGQPGILAAAGVTSFRLGQFSASLSEAAVANRLGDPLQAAGLDERPAALLRPFLGYVGQVTAPRTQPPQISDPLDLVLDRIVEEIV